MMSVGSARAGGERKTHDRGFEKHVIETFRTICQHACEMIKVDHSGFVRFDNLNQTGEVVAQWPEYEGLLHRKLPLRGVPAEDQMLDDDIPLVCSDVSAAKEELGEVRDLLLEFKIHSICIVKVFFRGIAVGSFSFDSVGKRREFTGDDIKLCREFAFIAQKMIENAQLVDWFESFERATAAMASESDPERLTQTIVNQANILFGTESAGLYRRQIDASGNETLSEGVSGYILPKGVGMAWQLVDSTLPFLTTDDYGSYPLRDQNLESRFGSVLEVPLVKQSERIGVIYLSGRPGRAFTKEDADFLQRFADMATLALQHSALVTRMERLSTVAADISGYLVSRTLDDKLTAIARHATEILSAEMCGVFIIDEPGLLVLKASHGHAEGRFVKDTRLPIEDRPNSGFTGAIAYRLIDKHKQRKRPVINLFGPALQNDLAKQGHAYAGPEGKCHSILAVPLIIRRESDNDVISGMLRISNKKGADGHASQAIQFTDEDEWILRIFAQAVVVAIESAKLVDEINVRKDHYSQLLEALHTLVSNEPLKQRLSKIASNVVHIVDKSFCRILLMDRSREYLDVEATAVHPNKGVEWNEQGRERTPIVGWPFLKQALDDGEPYDLQYPHAMLDRLSDLLEIRKDGHPARIRALYSVPLIAGSEAIGLLSVGNLLEAPPELCGFAQHHKDFINAIAAEASVVIDRELRQKRREDLLSRVPEALTRIRAEAEGAKDLMVIAEVIRSVFECVDAGFLVQAAPSLPIDLVTASGTRTRAAQSSAEELQLRDLLSDRAADDPTTVSKHFASLSRNLGSMRDVKTAARLAVRIEFAPGARALIFVSHDADGGTLTATIDQGILERLANHCASSLTQAIVSDQLQRARKGVHQVAIDLAVGDQRSALQNVADGIRSATGSDIVTLYRTRPSDGEIIGAATVSPVTESAGNARSSPESAVGRVLQLSDIYIADHARTDAILGGSFVDRKGIEYSVGNPLWVKDETTAGERLTVGVLFVNYRTPHKLTDEELDIIRMFSHLAAVAIRNQDVFERERRKAMSQQSLRECVQALTETTDLPTALARLSDHAFRLACVSGRDIANVAVALFNEGTLANLEISPSGADIARARVQLRVITHNEPIASTLRKGEATLRMQLANYTPLAFTTLHSDTRSQLVVPIGGGTQNFGVICVESTNAFGLNDDDVRAFELFAQMASEAIYAKLREATLTDIALFYIKSGVILHRNRAGIRNLVNWTAILKEDVELADSLSPRARESLSYVDRSAQALNDVLRTTTADFKRLPSHAINSCLSDWETRLNEDQSFTGIKRLFAIDSTDGINVRMDADLMREVFNIFSTNSRTAMQNASTKTLSVTTALTDNRCQITIADTGMGMDAETAERIRKSLRSIARGGGVGIGLLTAQLIITQSGGEILEPRTGSEGTTFTIALPIAQPEN